jgi:hypothetical protein
MEPKLKNPQMAIFVDCKSYHSAKISSQILGEPQEVQLGSVVTQYVLFFSIRHTQGVELHLAPHHFIAQ